MSWQRYTAESPHQHRHRVCPRSGFTSPLCEDRRENLAATKTGLETLQFPIETSTAILSKYNFKLRNDKFSSPRRHLLLSVLSIRDVNQAKSQS